MSRWPTRWLFASWFAYWAALIVFKLGPAIGAVWRATRAATGQGNVTAGFSNGVLSLVVTHSGRTAWSGSAHFLELAGWIAVPPLLAWLVWVAQRRRAESQIIAGG